ncbi:hypothetical protein [Methylobacter sp. YRD-M1]|uniref:hypothetical protein n=1 Tax=Methylobacter sp. YRD-M1 TaxID=2911520 RepID=UPI00227CB54F|nr:hypothetical protein [Methylobacter sp. YRD-M1]WAK02242.1 hypothetical protein LZ558_00245 [Methylobacter sp. YRD-M1]
MTAQEIEQLQQAAEFIYKGLKITNKPKQDNYYKSLILKWESNQIFKDQVSAIAKGLQLKVVHASVDYGVIILPLNENSLFSFGGLQNIRKNLGCKGTDDAVLRRGVISLAMIAVMASFFRDEIQVIEYKEKIETQTLSGIVSLLLDICNSLKEKYDTDKADIPEYMREGWEIILRLPTVKEGSSSNINSISGLITRIANLFVDEGLLKEDTHARDDLAWFPMKRFIEQSKRETSTGIFNYCMEIHYEQKKKFEERI